MVLWHMAEWNRFVKGQLTKKEGKTVEAEQSNWVHNTAFATLQTKISRRSCSLYTAYKRREAYFELTYHLSWYDGNDFMDSSMRLTLTRVIRSSHLTSWSYDERLVGIVLHVDSRRRKSLRVQGKRIQAAWLASQGHEEENTAINHPPVQVLFIHKVNEGRTQQTAEWGNAHLSEEQRHGEREDISKSCYYLTL